jgi:hypothetical protein
MTTYKFGFQIIDIDGQPSLNNPQPVASFAACAAAGLKAYRQALAKMPFCEIQFYVEKGTKSGAPGDEAPINFGNSAAGVAVWAGTGYETDFKVPESMMSKIIRQLADTTSHARLCVDEIIRLAKESDRAWQNEEQTSR